MRDEMRRDERRLLAGIQPHGPKAQTSTLQQTSHTLQTQTQSESKNINYTSLHARFSFGSTGTSHACHTSLSFLYFSECKRKSGTERPALSPSRSFALNLCLSLSQHDRSLSLSLLDWPPSLLLFLGAVHWLLIKASQSEDREHCGAAFL